MARKKNNHLKPLVPPSPPPLLVEALRANYNLGYWKGFMTGFLVTMAFWIFFIIIVGVME